MLLIASSYLERLIETQYWSLGIFSVSKLLVIHVTFYQGVEVEIRSYIVHVGLEGEKVIRGNYFQLTRRDNDNVFKQFSLTLTREKDQDKNRRWTENKTECFLS